MLYLMNYNALIESQLLLLTVGPVCLLDAAVVGDVLALRVDAVEGEAEVRDLEINKKT